MLGFMLRKMANKKWMVFALLIGNLLLVSITCANAMYGKAILQRTLTQNLAQYMEENNVYPGLITVRTGSTVSRNYQTLEAAQTVREMPEAFGLPVREAVEHIFVGPVKAVSELERSDGVSATIALGMLNDLEAYAQIVAGRFYADQPSEDGTVDVIVSERGMMDMNLIMGECITLPKVFTETGEALRVRVCGVFRNRAQDDPYWVRSPSTFMSECLMDPGIFERLFLGESGRTAINGQFYMLLDYTAMRGDAAKHLLETAKDYQRHFEHIDGQNYRDSFSAILEGFLNTEKKVTVTLWVLQVPIFMLLAAFIFMVSRQLLEMEQNEIAVLRSRGASQGQIIWTYLLQSLIAALAAFFAGVPLGVFLVQVLGSANAFMEFVRRRALPVEIDGRVLLFGAAAAAFGIAAMVLPVFRHSNASIVGHKRDRQRGGTRPLWQRLGLDFALLGAALYGLYAFRSQKEALAQRVVDGASLDPLLYISSSLFMIGAGLVMLRVLPLLTRLVFRLFRRRWSPALYAAFLQVIRTRYRQNFIMIFLILTIALGVFNARAARTINTGEEDNIRYGIGADLVLQEKWSDNSGQRSMDPSLELVYREPDFYRYQNLDGAAHVTRVMRANDVSVSVENGWLRSVQVMGIHTRSFGETAWFRRDLLPRHINEDLNAIAANARGVLLSRNFETQYGFRLGDAIAYQSGRGKSTRGIVYGFVDYWPGYSPISYSRGSDGLYRQSDNYLIVANLNQLQADWGVTPYEIWIDAEGSTRFIYDFAEAENLSFVSFRDASAEIVRLKNDPVFQGTNGILTVGFIVAVLLCAVGFLIYWILSIKARALQFGIYRAMGLSMREMVSMLLTEQLLISVTAIVTGVAVGRATSALFVPLIQLTYAAYDNPLPATVTGDPADMIRLLAIVGAMMIACMAILGGLISRMKIAQALKLGED